MKKSNKSVNNNSLLILSIVLLVMVLVAIWQFKNVQLENVQPNKSATEENIITSKDMKFSIEVPKDFEVEEKFTSLILKKGENYILIGRNGTNFDSLESYIKDLSEKNRFSFLEQKNAKIDGLESINGMMQPESSSVLSSKAYFVYSDYFVYTLETSSEALFGTLDEIAKTFRYNP